MANGAGFAGTVDFTGLPAGLGVAVAPPVVPCGGYAGTVDFTGLPAGLGRRRRHAAAPLGGRLVHYLLHQQAAADARERRGLLERWNAMRAAQRGRALAWQREIDRRQATVSAYAVLFAEL